MMVFHHISFMPKKTTLQDIADHAGVSIASVDRVINGRGGVSPKTEAKILVWANRLHLDRRMFRTQLPTLRIAVVMPSAHNPFFAALRDTFIALESLTAEIQMRLFIQSIDPLDAPAIVKKIDHISSSYDGFIVCCPDHAHISRAISGLSQNKPVVTLVTDIPASGRIAYVGPDNRQIGRVAGELMGRFLATGGGKVLIILGHAGFLGQKQREIGFREVVDERFPALEILSPVESGEDFTQAAHMAQKVFRAEPDIRGIYNISAGNYGIAQKLRDMGRADDVVFITHELTERRQDMLAQGVLDAVLDQNPRMEARRAIDVLAQFFNRVELSSPLSAHTPFEIFLRENCNS